MAAVFKIDPAGIFWWPRQRTSWFSYEFPNGHTATVFPDSSNRNQWEVKSSDPADRPAGVALGLTTEQVEQKLTAIYGLPPANEE